MDDPIVERVVDLEAPVAEVWAALTEPRRLSAWVGGEVVSLDVRPGGRGIVARDDGATRRIVVEAVQPERRMALRWWPFEDAGPAAAGRGTSVEFVLEPKDDGTRLTVVERPPFAMGETGQSESERGLPWAFEMAAP